MKMPSFRYSAFSDPRVALQVANELHRARNGSKGEGASIDESIDAERFVLDTLNKTGGLRNDLGRFDEISVVVVDLDMPGLDGLEFCRKITNPNIKKILLTGISADQQVIQAFNNNEIHYYLRKSDDNMEAMLEAAIKRMQHQYFVDISVNFKSDAIDHFAPLFSDPALADYFEELCVSLGVTEYYFHTNPSRYHLTLRHDSQSCLLVYTDEEVEAQLKILHEEDAPRSVISKIEARSHVPYFPTKDGFYIPELEKPESCLHQADLVPGDRDYYCALVGGNRSGNISYIVPSTPDGAFLH